MSAPDRASTQVGLRFPAPVVTGGAAFLTVPGGSLRTLSLSDGSVRWKRSGGGRSAPAVSEGVVYQRVLGRDAASVRALDVETGETS